MGRHGSRAKLTYNLIALSSVDLVVVFHRPTDLVEKMAAALQIFVSEMSKANLSTSQSPVESYATKKIKR